MNSKFNIWRGEAGAIPLIFVACVISIVYHLVEYSDFNDSVFLLPWSIGMAVFSFYLIRKRLKVISLTASSISFKHVLFRDRTVYLFDELDGFTTRLDAIPDDKSYYDIIFLKKNGKKIKTISSRYYSNYDEIRAFLNDKLPYLGIN
ncbi:hypothetical protein BKI52_35355 [marine bacterium AO1-C]|nr:hypothetical protein BKI52_35355 [marine bacterium AO1-C]